MLIATPDQMRAHAQRLAQCLERGLGDPAWIAHFLSRPDAHARLLALNALAGERLTSDEAGHWYVGLISRLAPQLEEDELVMLLRELLPLSPDHPAAASLYNALLLPQCAPASAPPLCFAITSCHRYLPQALGVLERLRAQGATAHVFVGSTDIPVARESGGIVHLPVEDSYEALTPKVLEAMTWVRRRYGAVAVAKVDDDMQLDYQFSVERLVKLVTQFPYFGHALGDPVDRCWHFGKTSKPVPVFGRRTRSQFAWGHFYVVDARALDILVREWVLYPGEFSGQIYEDRAIGETLFQHGIAVQHAPLPRLGIVLQHADRHTAAFAG